MVKRKSLRPDSLICMFFICVFVFLFYLSFRSQNWFGDGIRHVNMIRNYEFPKSTSTRHFLFPIVGWIFYHFLLSLGYKGNVPTAVQIMNAILASTSVGLYYYILNRLLQHRFVATIGALTLGFSACFAMHATDMTEIILGIFVLLVCTSLLIRWAERRNAILLSILGFIASLAVACYGTMVLSIPAILLAIWLYQKEKSNLEKDDSRGWINIACFCGGFLLGEISIIIFYKLINGMTSIEVLHLLISSNTAGGLWGNLENLSKIHYLFAGLSFNIIRPIAEWQGIRLLLGKGTIMEIGMAGISCLFTGVVSFLGLAYYMRNRKRIGGIQKRYLQVAVLWYIIPVCFSSWFYAGYDKLWIQPIMAYIFVLCVLLSNHLRYSLKRKFIYLLSIGAVSFIALANSLCVIFPKHYQENVAYKQAIKMGTYLSQKDLIVSHGWDPLAVYIRNFTQLRTFSLVDVSISRGRMTISTLDEEIRGTLDKRGGRVYFLGLLGSDAIWPRSLTKLGMKPESLNAYRKMSQIVKPILLDSEGKTKMELWLYEP